MTSNAGMAPTFAVGQALTGLDVPIDERGEPAVAFAARLAEIWGIPLRLLHVRSGSTPRSIDLDRVAAEANGRWPELTIEAAWLDGDDIAEAIVGAVMPTSLLVVSTDNANAWSFKNSVAERLVHRAGVPVILLGPMVGQLDRAGDIVVAYDGGPASVAALDAAEALAPALGRNLWLVTVEPDGQADVTRSDPVVEAERTARVGRIDPAIRPRSELLLSNDPVGAIEAFAAGIGAWLIVAGARDRADETRTTMSSITMGLVASAGRPVLVVGQ